MSQKKYFFTIDFEDFAFNFLRAMGGNSLFRSEALLSAMKECIELSELIGDVFTIFFSGNLLTQFPDIAKTLNENGFEIASHYFNHDDFNKDSLEIAEKNLNLIMELSLSSYGSTPLGFRAPRFSLETTDILYIELLKKYFNYDSSIVLDIDNRKNNLTCNKNFCHFPLFKKKLFPIPISTGGTYSKLNSHSQILKLLEQISMVGEIPVIYFHPYEFNCGSDFKLTYKEISNCKKIKKRSLHFYHWLRQNQWITPGYSNLVYNLLKKINSDGWKSMGNIASSLNNNINSKGLI